MEASQTMKFIGPLQHKQLYPRLFGSQVKHEDLIQSRQPPFVQQMPANDLKRFFADVLSILSTTMQKEGQDSQPLLMQLEDFAKIVESGRDRL